MSLVLYKNSFILKSNINEYIYNFLKLNNKSDLYEFIKLLFLNYSLLVKLIIQLQSLILCFYSKNV
jgi:hypothetical protein